MIFKLYDCDLGIKINGTSYSFEHVASVQVEDPERNKLTRGANVGNKLGLAYKEGATEPKRWTIPIMNMSAALKEVLDGAFDAQTRLDVYCISRTDGSSKMAKNAILANRPQQLNLDETAESMQVSLEFETFDSSEVHKA
jgi:hypothetical protein